MVLSASFPGFRYTGNSFEVYSTKKVNNLERCTEAGKEEEDHARLQDAKRYIRVC